jgi:hypothetical protein
MSKNILYTKFKIYNKFHKEAKLETWKNVQSFSFPTSIISIIPF